MKYTLSLSLLVAFTGASLHGQSFLNTVEVANSLTQPIYVGAPAGDEDRLFIAEENTGLIKILDLETETVLPTPYLNLGSKIVGGFGNDERGLLGVAFHPDYASNGFVYVNYIAPTPNRTVVERYTVSPTNPNQADLASASLVLTFNQPAGNHNAGWMGFGPNDGYLYIFTGDGGGGNDPSCHAQNLTNLLGNVLRIDVDSATPYAIPSSNPYFAQPPIRGEIWANGLRNPWRGSFDRSTGDLYLGDVGQTAGQGGREEVCFQSASSSGGENYGWKLMHGTNCYQTGNCVNPPACPPGNGLTLPIYDYATGGGNCTIVGGYVYRGCAMPDFVGTYFFGDFCSGRLWSLEYDGSTVTNFTERTTELGGPLGSLASFGEDARGELYIVQRGSAGASTGRILRIVADEASVWTDLGFAKPNPGGQVPLLEACGLLGAGQEARIILRRVPPSTAAALLFSFPPPNPIAFNFGTLVKGPSSAVAAATTPEGRIDLPAPGGLGPLSFLMQVAVVDTTNTFNLSISNAIEFTWPAP